jgi:hypothetical protein
LAPEKNPDASYSFGKGKLQQPQNRAMPNKSPNNRVKPRGALIPAQEDEEPICVLKVELDGGENIQHIKVYEGQLPEEIVDEFGRKFNLSERAKFRLLEQINEQINA